MSQKLYRSTRGDLELFSSNPGSGWELIGTVSPAATAEVGQLLERQDKLAAEERRLHTSLLKKRDQLDELAGELDAFVATPARVLAAMEKARRPCDADPVEPPPPPKQGTKLTHQEAVELFERVQKKRRGEF